MVDEGDYADRLLWTVFSPAPVPTPVAKMMPKVRPPCAYCQCAEKDHCKSGVFHSNYKDQMRQAPKPRGAICPTRHCTNPLCSCIAYQEPK